MGGTTLLTSSVAGTPIGACAAAGVTMIGGGVGGGVGVGDGVDAGVGVRVGVGDGWGEGDRLGLGVGCGTDCPEARNENAGATHTSIITARNLCNPKLF